MNSKTKHEKMMGHIVIYRGHVHHVLLFVLSLHYAHSKQKSQKKKLNIAQISITHE